MFESVSVITQIFHAHDLRRRCELVDRGIRLVHYTTADSALKILKNRDIWLRNVRCMNDYSEINHGISLLRESLHGPENTEIELPLKKLFATIDAKHEGLSTEAVTLFDGWIHSIEFETYVTCLSEHPASEDEFGRLSMWRAYAGGENGIAIILNTEAFQSDFQDFGVWSAPVHYYSKPEIASVIETIGRSFIDHPDILAAESRDSVKAQIFSFLRSMALSLKHPGFGEEREWRVFHTVGLDTEGETSFTTECIRGLPQLVMHFPLKRVEKAGAPDLSIDALMHSILIGPSIYPYTIKMALIRELKSMGVSNPEARVRASYIPFRA